MKPEQQQIAIATACGWTNVAPLIVKNVKHEGDDITVGISSDDGWIPDYLNDLNAMHEAEKVLTSEQHIDYMEWLGMCSDDYGRKVWAYVHCSASERARAFLRTLGLWKESNTQPVAEDSSVTSAVKDSFTTAQ